MKFANLAGRLTIITAQAQAIDVAEVSGGRFGPDPQAAFADWLAFTTWATSIDHTTGAAMDPSQLGPPVPHPAQVFAIGINYAEHAKEAAYPPDALPVTFTKFPTCLTGPDTEVPLPTDTVDWEVELVLAIAYRAERVPRDCAWKYIAGMTVGQDLSERTSQLVGVKPQFSLAKSHPGFGPTGPWLVTPDELPDRDNLAITCSVNGEVMQDARTSQLVYDIPELIFRLSSVCALLPGDLIFTGTPAGVGNARVPKRFLRNGDTLTSSIEGIGTITQRFTTRH